MHVCESVCVCVMGKGRVVRDEAGKVIAALGSAGIKCLLPLELTMSDRLYW